MGTEYWCQLTLCTQQLQGSQGMPPFLGKFLKFRYLEIASEAIVGSNIDIRHGTYIYGSKQPLYGSFSIAIRSKSSVNVAFCVICRLYDLSLHSAGSYNGGLELEVCQPMAKIRAVSRKSGYTGLLQVYIIAQLISEEQSYMACCYIRHDIKISFIRNDSRICNLDTFELQFYVCNTAYNL